MSTDTVTDPAVEPVTDAPPETTTIEPGTPNESLEDFAARHNEATTETGGVEELPPEGTETTGEVAVETTETTETAPATDEEMMARVNEMFGINASSLAEAKAQASELQDGAKRWSGFLAKATGKEQQIADLINTPVQVEAASTPVAAPTIEQFKLMAQALYLANGEPRPDADPEQIKQFEAIRKQNAITQYDMTSDPKGFIKSQLGELGLDMESIKQSVRQDLLQEQAQVAGIQSEVTKREAVAKEYEQKLYEGGDREKPTDFFKKVVAELDSIQAKGYDPNDPIRYENAFLKAGVEPLTPNPTRATIERGQTKPAVAKSKAPMLAQQIEDIKGGMDIGDFLVKHAVK